MKKFAFLAASCLVVAGPSSVLANPGDSGTVNGSSVRDFFNSGPQIDRDAMDEAAELEKRKAYLDQDPKTKPNLSPPVGSADASQPQGKPAAKGKNPPPTIVWKGDKLANSNKPYQGSKIGRFLRTVGDVLTPNWLIDFGLGPDDDTDRGPDNENSNY